jgi:biofilm PGA synthesis N-glycosyltransferase PgaC
MDNNRVMKDVPKYVVVTPARNESEFIEQTILSVTRQSVLPMKWVIVSDGSTDGTDDIVRRYCGKFPWIELVCMPPREERHFAGKVFSFNAGYAKVAGLDFDFIASLDADISFEPAYFEYLLGQFPRNAELGLAGTPFREGTSQYDYRFSRKEHVSGACQVFRRECFKAIGGYVPLKVGGIDLVAVVTARMKGWKTQTFDEMVCIHHRRIGTAGQSVFKASYKSGYHDFLMGVHPLWQLFRSIYQMSRKPFVIAGFLLLAGYLHAWISGAKRPVSQEFVIFRRKEQMDWLRRFISNAITRRAHSLEGPISNSGKSGA